MCESHVGEGISRRRKSIEIKECPWCGKVIKLKQGKEDPARKYGDCFECGVTWRSLAGKDKVEVAIF